MTTSRDWLVETIETSLHVLPPAPGVFDPLPLGDVVGRVSPHSHPLANLVGVARFAEEEAPARVAAVRELFASQGKAFGWVTGPATRPTDLARHLVSAGLVKVDEMAGMALQGLGRRIDVSPRIRVREAGAEELQGASDLMAASYGIPPEIARMFGEAMAGSRDRVRSRGYFAYLDDSARRATVTVASELQRAGLVTHRHGRIRIRDRKRLEQLACECYEAVRREFAEPAA